MNPKLLVLAILLSVNATAFAQGRILFYNFEAPTRVGSADSPLAGPGIWAQLLAGPTADSLAPVGAAAEHKADYPGYVLGPEISVPTVGYYQYGYVQMLAWDGRLWGNVFEDVPSDQFGATDVLPFAFGGPPPGTAYAPRFTRGAIVPVPEPTTIWLGAVGLAALWLRHQAKRESAGPRRSFVAFEWVPPLSRTPVAVSVHLFPASRAEGDTSFPLFPCCAWN